ncbi:putative bifunctional diguanylate cyclase/phosphodiesterase [Altererythrobacter sp. CC-YST694]|uniref:putative bifunctional diguanylate cyclase/phosphodiesterase n=1 Tax=Altererythrobacter sp. CC-YST694 TaxID=2755038 RepID=UPI001D003192|nr:EAL domain-containing protein [Altererythrobacter sp. CC-YST694]
MGRWWEMGPKRAFRWIFGSLERRLAGALLLLVLAATALQVVSEERAVTLRAETLNLQRAAANAENAGELIRAVADFHMQSHLALMPNPPETAENSLTDAAVRIDRQLTLLRISGAPLFELPDGTESVDQLGILVRDIRHEAALDGYDPDRLASIEARVAGMQSFSRSIEWMLDRERDEAYTQLIASTNSWHTRASAIGVAMVALALAMLADVMFNILPALRRMHNTIRRLASGDLHFEIEQFRLEELSALAGPLETFRRNALAVQSLAFTDSSTGLPNRRAFMEQTLARLEAGPGKGEAGLAVMVVDVDNFKHVNDDYGHATGDMLVRQVGERMQRVLGARAIVARSGGDEFVICAPYSDRQSAEAIGSRLVTAMQEPFDLGGFTVAITISLGLVETQGASGEVAVHALLNRADLALYASKNNGRNQASCYTADLENERDADRRLERDLTGAFERGQLHMVYQPIHSTADREDEVEALVRWTHPELGEVSPAHFIPAAERSNQIVRLGSWIIERALADLANWPDLTMSLNISSMQLQQDGFVGFLMRCCRKHEIASRRVILEVTESLSIERNTRALMTLNLLRNAGFRIALDDFGTGYSSLCLMKTFRFDRLKLDRSLIADLGKDPTSQAVFDAAVTMALKIGAEVVAEGISDEELVEPVRRAGCTHMQGFHYSRPIEAAEVLPYFARAREERLRVA